LPRSSWPGGRASDGRQWVRRATLFALLLFFGQVYDGYLARQALAILDFIDDRHPFGGGQVTALSLGRSCLAKFHELCFRIELDGNLLGVRVFFLSGTEGECFCRLINTDYHALGSLTAQALLPLS